MADTIDITTIIVERTSQLPRTGRLLDNGTPSTGTVYMYQGKPIAGGAGWRVRVWVPDNGANNDRTEAGIPHAAAAA